MKLTITTLVIVEGSYIQGMENSLEEHPGKAYQELETKWKTNMVMMPIKIMYHYISKLSKT